MQDNLNRLKGSSLSWSPWISSDVHPICWLGDNGR